MSKIKIQGHSSGNGLVTITAPNTENSTTLTIPDITGTALTSADTGTVTQVIVHPDAVNRFISGRKNLIINGGFDVWQRGTSFIGIGNAAYQTDRFKGRTGSSTDFVTADVTKGTSTLPNSSKVNTFKITATSSGIGYLGVSQKFEQSVFDYIGNRAVTMSCWIKTNRTDITFRHSNINNFSVGPYNADGTWQKVSGTYTLPSGSISSQESFGLLSFANNSSSHNIGDYIEVTQVQLELGSLATDFEHRSYGEELALCQRYYFDSRTGTVAITTVNPTGTCFPSRYMGLQMYGASGYSRVAGGHSFPVQMRDIPDTFLYSPSGALGKVAVYNICQTDVGSGFHLERVSKVGWAYVDGSNLVYNSLRYIYEVIADAEL